ncbi:MAG: PEP-CTERM sorting domain-containing protein, partial [Acidobacteriota bacterium]|nr:PEP-CTERM sorting domain-containing protein [Acidobacteriota bacterium]
MDGFFGFTSDTAISSILVEIDETHLGAGQAQPYTMDKMEFALVPEPGTWVLLYAGMGVVCVLRMRGLVRG